MAERRPDMATFRPALQTAIKTWWAAEGDITVSTSPTPTVYSRPPLSFANDGYSPGSDPAFVEVDYLPGTGQDTGNVGTPIKILPAILQATIYVQEQTGTELADKIMDRWASMLKEISVNTLHAFSTDDPIEAPAPPQGFWGQVVRTACLRITQPVTS